ncbi:MAG: rhodanese-like domain-containing protein [Thiobacillus sp.]|nr:rhodanese-like domain-containing protein [Thiobacillus sp.]
MRRSLRHLAAVALLAMSGYACSLESAGPELGAPEALKRVEAGQLTLIDIRRPEEWRQTGIARGAVAIDMRRSDFAEALLKQVGGDRNAAIAIICRTGNRTTQLQRQLLKLGFTQVYNVREGMAGSAAGPGWLRQGLPVAPCANC